MIAASAIRTPESSMSISASNSRRQLYVHILFHVGKSNLKAFASGRHVNDAISHL